MNEFKISLLLINFNNYPFIKTCIDSVLNQSLPFDEILIFDNGSKDGSVNFLNGLKDVGIYFNKENIGFCSAFNFLYEKSKGDFILLINPDVKLPVDFNEKLKYFIKSIDLKNIGSIAPKILRAEGDELNETDIIDSTGIYLNPFFRALDRGSNEKDTGKYEKMEYVFGSTGALSLFNKKALEDIKFEKQVLDERFFVYREDFDLSFRLQWKGYKTIYNPLIFAYHKRYNLPERRRNMPKEINYHSLKNRFLIRAKNESILLFLVLSPLTFIYEILIFIYCLFFERSSLRSYIYFLKNFKSTLKWRRFTLKYRNVSSFYILSYFLWKRKKYPY